MYKDIITISTVTLAPMWGQKERNLNRIEGYIEAAAKRGSDLVLFPEMGLTGYDDETDVELEQKMQYRLAEEPSGHACTELAELAKGLGIYAFVGMPIREPSGLPGTPDTIYNGLAAFSPEGLVGVYRKMHLPNDEPNWATRGDSPMIVDSPWGPIGLGICYDSYRFPELSRYYAAKGCRLYLNPTALAFGPGRATFGSAALEAIAIRDGMFVVSANLGGQDLLNRFWGGSSIIGPGSRDSEAHYYAGMPFTADGASEEAMYTATVDLALAKRQLFRKNARIGASDWRPDRYLEMLQDVLADGPFATEDGPEPEDA